MKLTTTIHYFFRCSLLVFSLICFTISSVSAEVHPKNDLDNEFAQISGTVLDEDGEALIGASVRAKGTTAGALTDEQGRFSFDVPDGVTTLIISYIGYKTLEVNIEGKTSVTIDMVATASTLEQVVVTGYTTQKKANLTGAVTAVNADAIENRPITSAAVAMQGAAPGVFINQNSGQPGRDNVLIRIRGVGTLNNANPLILVDGIEAPISNLNPDDIESITILKDAASAAIYGSRAANGVVLVTTKNGNGREGVSFNYNGYIGTTEGIRLPELITDAAAFAELHNEAQTNFGEAPKYTDQDIANFRANGPNSNIMDELFSSAPIQQHNFSVAGSSSNTDFRFSFGYLDQQGIMEKTGFDRYTSRFNLNTRVNEQVTIGVNLALTRGDRIGHQENPGNLIANMLRSLPVDRIRNDNGDLLRPVFGVGNAWFNVIENEFNRKENDVLGSTFIEYEIIPGLRVKGTAAINYRHNFDRTLRFTSPSADPLTNVVTVGPNESRSASRATWNGVNITTWLQATYEKTFGKNYFKILGGFNQETSQSESFWAGRTTFISNNVLTLNAGDPSTATNSESATQWALQSYFGRVNYVLDDRYLFEANLRYDGSSRFLNEKWGLFPSFSAGWIISKETFFNSSAIDFLKIRASWGQLGNQNIGNFSYARTLSLSENYNFGGSIVQGVAQTSLGNPDLVWETTTSSNIGINAELFNSRIQLEADYFIRTTEDILFNVPVPTISGFGSQILNSAEVENKGWEISLFYRDNFGDFRFGIGGNVTHVKNEVLKLNKLLGEEEVDRRISGANAGQTVLQPGSPIGAYFGYRSLGIFRNQSEFESAADHTGINALYGPGDVRLEDLNGDGVIDAEDRQVIGNQDPRWIYGLNLDFGWKGFDLAVLVQGAASYQTYGSNELFWPFNNLHTTDTRWLDRWTPDNTDATFPRVFLGGDGWPSTSASNSFWLLDRSHLRIKNVQFSYTLPQSLMDNSFLQSVQIYVNAQNLATFTSFPFFDPERPRGVNRAWDSFPNLRIISGGINASF
ncbi:MAG: TonB-dependent receptor [Bacteroidia bacterium]|nr:TonB-dependent receptor [Bacteroidia bacterium]